MKISKRFLVSFVFILLILLSSIICFLLVLSVGRKSSQQKVHDTVFKNYRYLQVDIRSGESNDGVFNLQEREIPDDGFISYQSGDTEYTLISEIGFFKRYAYCTGICRCDSQKKKGLFGRRGSKLSILGAAAAAGLVVKFFEIPKYGYEYVFMGDKFIKECQQALGDRCPEDQQVIEVDECEMVSKKKLKIVKGKLLEDLLEDDENFDENKQYYGKVFERIGKGPIKKFQYICEGKCRNIDFTDDEEKRERSDKTRCEDLHLKRKFSMYFEDSSSGSFNWVGNKVWGTGTPTPRDVLYEDRITPRISRPIPRDRDDKMEKEGNSEDQDDDNAEEEEDTIEEEEEMEEVYETIDEETLAMERDEVARRKFVKEKYLDKFCLQFGTEGVKYRTTIYSDGWSDKEENKKVLEEREKERLDNKKNYFKNLNKKRKKKKFEEEHDGFVDEKKTKVRKVYIHKESQQICEAEEESISCYRKY